ncbi:basic leucine zipper 6-like isoform X1 [Cucurbita pepo subsp. pepo]|uniref:basic leucine zipper 6-like isoform X1 n=1 Tax=Cucurbita pepo subsp. pepo TaxID=3664 RepID=UPI000C9D5D87|nr:basic leucine zipper 6-like isoform X1 [Cucurbita pepo subsp. pepo]
MPNLPPKFPNFNTPNPPAHDDFLSFSSPRQSLHHRSVSDSIAFLETPTMNQTILGSAAPSNNNAFDAFDEDDQPTSSEAHNDGITDSKRVKRILANRQSARRSRVRKLQYITELEQSISTLQAEVSMLSPQVAFLDQQRLLLNVDNSALKQRIASLSQDNIFKDGCAAHEEALKREIERLGQLYHRQQKNRRMDSNGPSPVAANEPISPGDKNQRLLYV